MGYTALYIVLRKGQDNWVMMCFLSTDDGFKSFLSIEENEMQLSPVDRCGNGEQSRDYGWVGRRESMEK